jgi:hypothetical protein
VYDQTQSSNAMFIYFTNKFNVVIFFSITCVALLQVIYTSFIIVYTMLESHTSMQV